MLLFHTTIFYFLFFILTLISFLLTVIWLQSAHPLTPRGTSRSILLEWVPLKKCMRCPTPIRHREALKRFDLATILFIFLSKLIISSHGSVHVNRYKSVLQLLVNQHMPKSRSPPKTIDASQTQCSCIFLALAEGTIHSILSYAAPRYQRAHLLCQLGLTCHPMSKAVREGFHLVWKAIHLQDYGAANPAVPRR